MMSDCQVNVGNKVDSIIESVRIGDANVRAIWNNYERN
jgi:hypothetical protein